VRSDQEQRRRAVEETEHSFIVEASAGTGKTSTLTNRILHLVLEKGPLGPPLRLSQICAITFTEKAAGEMKIRLRQKFEEAASDGSNGMPPAPRVRRARDALADIEIASISTFHAFAVSLLKERPIEAGLDPHFTALDEMRSELFSREVWDSWISRALAERKPALENALRNGLGLEALQDLARTLRLCGQTLRGLACDSPPEEAEVRQKILELLQVGGGFLEKNCNANDKLLDHLERAIEWLKHPENDGLKPSKPGKAGLAANWKGGKATTEEVQAFVREVVDFRDACRLRPTHRLIREIIDWIRTEFLPEWDARKRAGGLLDFDDQLWLARDLLIKSKAVRSEFQSRYATLLVDEFQDTDLVQWDIVRLLASANLEETDLAKLRPGPGKLLIVGDPKQSIYRFRNADIETYLEAADPLTTQALGLERLELTMNFRSVPSILRFVDAVFAGAMQAPADGRYQPDYLPFGGQGDRTEEPDPPSVYLLGDRKAENGYNSVRAFLECEAARIAGVISGIPGSPSWKVQNSRGQEGGNWRTPRYGDIAILLPVLSRADILEEALRDRGIPYVLEGGKFYYARSEVSSAITALRAVANPNDSVALYGALRSIFFGISDEDMLRARMQGQPLDYRTRVPQDSALAYPFEVLRDLHRNRHERRASETLETLLQKTGAREVLAARGMQSVANLNKLARTLRTLQGEATFSQIVDLLSTMDEEGLAESESRLMEERSDAVRILSIHKSKGLDFPIVFVAALGLERRNQSKRILVDLHRKKMFAISLGAKKSGLQTPGWKALMEEEQKRENAELVRLLYVALTRARDYLVLCTHTKGWKVSQSGQSIPDTERTRLKPLSSFVEGNLSNDTGLVRWIDVHKLDISKKPIQPSLLAATQDWQSVVEKEYGSLDAMLRHTPSSRNLRAAGQNQDAPDYENHAPEERNQGSPGSRAVRLGVAFHEVMEQVNLFSPETWNGSLQELIAPHSLDRDSVRRLEQMVRTVLSADLFDRVRNAAKSGGRVLRELPFVRPLEGGAVEEGKIDLLFEEKEGWVLVDYKTDWMSTQADDAENYFRQKYAAQISEYVQALQAIPVKVAAAYLLLARTGTAVQMV
jgi:ATP-dependent helicase/nuclease subunit A